MSQPPKVLSESQIAARLAAELAGWSLVEGALQRSFPTAGWKSALMAAMAVGHLAELAWHHPDLQIRYGELVVRLWTHESRGVTGRDFALAARIDDCLDWRPGKDTDALTGTPDDPRYAYLT